MLNIAPLDYERWAVLVSPLLVPEAVSIGAKPPTRPTEPVGPASAALNHPGSRAGAKLKRSESRPPELGPKTLDRDPEHPLNGLHPTDSNWYFQLPSEIQNSAQVRRVVDLRKVIELYDRPESTRGTTVSVSG